MTLASKVDEPFIGTTFANRYLIIEELGRGGMGRVFKALDKEINENIALKVLRPEISSDEKMIERFRNELKFARRISHKNVCRMYDLSKEGETYFISMEYVPGENLKNALKSEESFNLGKVILIAKQICEGLTAAHQLGIVHRDLKPQNLMIDREGNVHVMDFGIARLLTAEGMTQSGIMVGTPDYMSPEQVASEEVDHRSDIYSLGVILYEMVTGQVPFKGDTALSIALKHKTETAKDPTSFNVQIPKKLSGLILRCLEKDKEKRYQSAQEVLSELDAIEKKTQVINKLLVKTTLKAKKRKGRTFAALETLLLLALIIWGGSIVYKHFVKTKNGETEEKLSVIPAVRSKKIKELPSPYGILEISSVPEGAEIYLDNKLEGATPLKREFPQGDYKILIKKVPGYKEITDILKVSVGETSIKNYKLIPEYLLIVESTPESADVRIDGNYMGKTPIQLELPTNRCQLNIEKDPQWTKIDEKLTLIPGRNLIKRSLEKMKYSLFIKTNPSGARVFIGDRLVGISPIKKLDLFGECGIKIEKDGYASIADSITVYSDIEKTYDLIKIEAKGSETVNVRGESSVRMEQSKKEEIKKEPEVTELPKKQLDGISIDQAPINTVLEPLELWNYFGQGSGEAPFPTDITVDKSGYVYISDAKNNLIYKLKSDGKFVEKWDFRIKVDGKGIPYGILADDSGYVYVSDVSNHRILKFTSNGGIIGKWDTLGVAGKFNSPQDMAVDASGYIYVCDTGNHRIVKLTSDGKLITIWGSYGKEVGKFNKPSGIAIDDSGYCFIADSENHRIQIFSTGGIFFGELNTGYTPRGIAVDNLGYIYITATLRGKIYKYTSKGFLVNEYGSKGNKLDQFNSARGIAIDNLGYAFIADSSNNRIRKFKIK